VGNFLVMVPAMGREVEAGILFQAGLGYAKDVRSQNPSGTAESDWALAASFARQNGSGAPVVTDSSTGSWVVAVGTWFHGDGYASGAEKRLLHQFLTSSAEEVARGLEGFFVLIFGDSRTREVVVVTDIVGSCHCFQRSLPGVTALSGSSLLLASLEEFQLDWVGCQEFLHTGIIYEDRTCYQEVRKLGPAGVFRFDGNAPKASQRYWHAANLRPETLRGRSAVDALWERMTIAAKSIHRLYAKPVCDLTGGYDSRALVAAFLGAGVQCATAVSGSPDDADVIISRSLAEKLNLRHVHTDRAQNISFDQVQDCLALTDGEYDLIEYSSIRAVHRRLSEEFEISINGSFGEVARGYWWELLFPLIGARKQLDARKVSLRRYAAQSGDASIIPPGERLDLVDHSAAVINRTNAGLFSYPNTFQMDHAYLMMRMQRWQGRIASSTNQIWPCLSPFMFRSVLETMLQTQSLLRWRSLLIRKMLGKFSPRIAEHRLEHGFPAEPSNWRNFHRFYPLAGYFGRKVLNKFGGRLGFHHAARRDRIINARLQLWRDERVQELLRPANMKLSAWMDSAALEDFLKRSQGENFQLSGQWGRLLTLECALRVATRQRQRYTA
jgi:hypothetical protein